MQIIKTPLTLCSYWGFAVNLSSYTFYQLFCLVPRWSVCNVNSHHAPLSCVPTLLILKRLKESPIYKYVRQRHHIPAGPVATARSQMTIIFTFINTWRTVYNYSKCSKTNKQTQNLQIDKNWDSTIIMVKTCTSAPSHFPCISCKL